MLQAWKEVVDDKKPTNWALFSYDGQSYDLKLAGKGGNIKFCVFFSFSFFFIYLLIRYWQSRCTFHHYHDINLTFSFFYCNCM